MSSIELYPFFYEYLTISYLCMCIKVSLYYIFSVFLNYVGNHMVFFYGIDLEAYRLQAMFFLFNVASCVSHTQKIS